MEVGKSRIQHLWESFALTFLGCRSSLTPSDGFMMGVAMVTNKDGTDPSLILCWKTFEDGKVTGITPLAKLLTPVDVHAMEPMSDYPVQELNEAFYKELADLAESMPVEQITPEYFQDPSGGGAHNPVWDDLLNNVFMPWKKN